jgi:hypothetical protein
MLDPFFLSAALDRPMVAVIYSLSLLSEFLSPIRTVSNVINPDNRPNKGKTHRVGVAGSVGRLAGWFNHWVQVMDQWIHHLR